MPSRRDMRRTAPRFGDHLARHEQSKLDADTSKPDARATRLTAGSDVMGPRQFAPLHPAPIVDDRERCLSRIGQQADARCSRVERIRDDFGEDRLLERSGVRVPQIFEKMLEVDAGFAHGGILSPAGPGRAGARLGLQAPAAGLHLLREGEFPICQRSCRWWG